MMLLKGVHHRLLDRVVGYVRGKFIPVPYYSKGWGDLTYPQTVQSWLAHYSEQLRTHGKRPLEGFHLEWRRNKVLSTSKVEILEGTFQSPSPLSRLEIENNTGYVMKVQPTKQPFPNFNPTVVLLAGTGEHGFTRRLHSVASPLAKEGVSSLILESPYYGKRRLKGQIGSKLKTVSDLGILGRITIEETHALLRYCISEGPGPYAVCGVSMGGLHSAMVASLAPYPCGAVCWLAPTSASPVFSDGLLADLLDWDLLRKFAPSPEKDPKSFLREFLSFTDIENFDAPVCPEHVHIVVLQAAEHDEYIPLHAYRRWQNLIKKRWYGANLRWISGGHVSGTIFKYKEMREQILSVIQSMVVKRDIIL